MTKQPSITIRLKGGIGNQMFQYALGRSLSMKNGLTLKMDAYTGFKNDFYKRKYSLHHLSMSNDIEILEYFIYPRFKSYLNKSYDLLNINHNKRYLYIEKNLKYDPNIFKIRWNSYIDGYWQSEKYFENICSIIKNELKVKYKLSGICKNFSEKIQNSNSISLHIRKLHGVSKDGKIDFNASNLYRFNIIDYVKNAMAYINQHTEGGVVFVFTDDPKWVSERLNIPNDTYIIGNMNYGRDYEDIRLMSLCKHNIIANSSFSWWGAWLNNNKDKIVISPKVWFVDQEKNKETKDLIPNSWIRM